MNAEEEMAERGRVLTDYFDAKKRLAALKNEAQRIGEALRVLGHSLIMFPADATMSPDVEGILSDPDKLRRLVRELQEQAYNPSDVFHEPTTENLVGAMAYPTGLC